MVRSLLLSVAHTILENPRPPDYLRSRFHYELPPAAPLHRNSHPTRTCIVQVNEGLENCTVRSIDESSTLRDNPANYRLSCVTNMYDDVTVTVFPPVGAAQWTR